MISLNLLKTISNVSNTRRVIILLLLFQQFLIGDTLSIGGNKPEDLIVEGTGVSLAEMLSNMPMSSIFDNKRMTFPVTNDMNNMFNSGKPVRGGGLNSNNFLEFVLAHSRTPNNNRRWGSKRSGPKRCTPLTPKPKPGFLGKVWGFILPKKKKKEGLLCVEDLLAAFAEGGTGGMSKSESRALDNINININNIPQTVTYTTTSTTTTTTTHAPPVEVIEEPKWTWIEVENYLKKMRLIDEVHPMAKLKNDKTTQQPPLIVIASANTSQALIDPTVTPNNIYDKLPSYMKIRFPNADNSQKTLLNFQKDQEDEGQSSPLSSISKFIFGSPSIFTGRPMGGPKKEQSNGGYSYVAGRHPVPTISFPPLIRPHPRPESPPPPPPILHTPNHHISPPSFPPPYVPPKPDFQPPVEHSPHSSEFRAPWSNRQTIPLLLRPFVGAFPNLYRPSKGHLFPKFRRHPPVYFPHHSVEVQPAQQDLFNEEDPPHVIDHHHEIEDESPIIEEDHRPSIHNYETFDGESPEPQHIHHGEEPSHQSDFQTLEGYPQQPVTEEISHPSPENEIPSHQDQPTLEEISHPSPEEVISINPSHQPVKSFPPSEADGFQNIVEDPPNSKIYFPINDTYSLLEGDPTPTPKRYRPDLEFPNSSEQKTTTPEWLNLLMLFQEDKHKPMQNLTETSMPMTMSIANENLLMDNTSMSNQMSPENTGDPFKLRNYLLAKLASKNMNETRETPSESIGYSTLFKTSGDFTSLFSADDDRNPFKQEVLIMNPGNEPLSEINQVDPQGPSQIMHTTSDGFEPTIITLDPIPMENFDQQKSTVPDDKKQNKNPEAKFQEQSTNLDNPIINVESMHMESLNNGEFQPIAEATTNQLLIKNQINSQEKAVETITTTTETSLQVKVP